jgi:predicted RNase H-like HicB family nuclease
MYHFLIIIEQGSNNYSAYAPDLPGCIATGKTLDEVQKNMKEAIEMHLRGMIDDNEPIPTPQSVAAFMDVPAPVPAAKIERQNR